MYADIEHGSPKA